MGIFGAMTTAITGIRAQSYGLERISDNIANSQTIGYKRSDATFADFVPDSPANNQALGVVNAFSRPTNNVQGDIANHEVSTYMAVNGDGYFIASEQTDTVDGQPVFGSDDLYTRRGDFSFNETGHLVNEAGYYLQGLPIDATTGNPTGSSPEVIQVSNDFLPASATNEIDYRANLAEYPLTAEADSAVPGSELLSPDDFAVDPTVGGAGYVQANEASTFIDQTISGSSLTAYDAAGASIDVQFRWGKTSGTLELASSEGSVVGTPGTLSSNIAGFNDGAAATVAGNAVGNPADIGGGTPETFDIDIGGTVNTYTISDADIDTLAGLQTEINNDFPGVASIVNGDELHLTAQNKTDSIEIIDNGGAGDAGLSAGTTNPTPSANDLFRISVDGDDYDFNIGTDAGELNDLTDLVDEINNTAGLSQAITAVRDGDALNLTSDDLATSFTVGGDTNAVNGLGQTTGTHDPTNTGTDTWNLFYLEDSNASGTDPAWRNTDQSYTFDSAGRMNPDVVSTTIQDFAVDGIELGEITLNHGSDGITQFADDNGTVKVTDIGQDGYASGELVDISVSEDGRVAANYTNGRSIDIAEVTLASFNGDNGLAKTDGGAFKATPESGPPILGSLGDVVGSALEESNTDIADEFSKLIVTQQAYAANTRIISTADEMVQEALNMIR